MDPMTLLMFLLLTRRRRREGEEEREMDDLMLPLLLLSTSGQFATCGAGSPLQPPAVPVSGPATPVAPVVTVPAAPPAFNPNLLLFMALFAGAEDFDLFRRHD